MFTTSYSKASNIFSVKIFCNRIYCIIYKETYKPHPVQKLGENCLSSENYYRLFLTLKRTCDIQKLSIPLLDFCKDIVPAVGRTNLRGFFLTVGTFSLWIWILSRNNLKHLSIKFSGKPFFWGIFSKTVLLWMEHWQVRAYSKTSI